MKKINFLKKAGAVLLAVLCMTSLIALPASAASTSVYSIDFSTQTEIPAASVHDGWSTSAGYHYRKSAGGHSLVTDSSIGKKVFAFSNAGFSQITSNKWSLFYYHTGKTDSADQPYGQNFVVNYKFAVDTMPAGDAFEFGVFNSKSEAPNYSNAAVFKGGEDGITMMMGMKGGAAPDSSDKVKAHSGNTEKKLDFGVYYTVSVAYDLTNKVTKVYLDGELVHTYDNFYNFSNLQSNFIIDGISAGGVFVKFWNNDAGTLIKFRSMDIYTGSDIADTANAQTLKEIKSYVDLSVLSAEVAAQAKAVINQKQESVFAGTADTSTILAETKTALDAIALSEYKTWATGYVDTYIDKDTLTAEEEAIIDGYINTAKTAITAATTVEGVKAAVKTCTDSINGSALPRRKATLKTALASYLDTTGFGEDAIKAIGDYIATVNAQIDAAADVDAADKAYTDALAVLDTMDYEERVRLLCEQIETYIDTSAYTKDQQSAFNRVISMRCDEIYELSDLEDAAAIIEAAKAELDALKVEYDAENAAKAAETTAADETTEAPAEDEGGCGSYSTASVLTLGLILAAVLYVVKKKRAVN